MAGCQAVVPREQLARLRLDRLADFGEASRAAGGRFVQIDHQRPGAVARDRTIGRIVRALWVEIIGMGLELLAHIIALALDWFAIRRGDPREGIEARVDGGDERVAMIKVAGFTGAEIAIAIGVRDGRGAALGVDPFD